MKPFEIRCKDVQELRELVTQNENSPTTIFRGVSRPEYDLVSSFARILEGREIDQNCAAELRLFNEVLTVEGITPTDDQFATLDALLPRLALMQHHGVPTRLLDWTTSINVALFFALRSINGTESCAIFATDTRSFRPLQLNIEAAHDLDLWGNLTPSQLFFLNRPAEVNWFRIQPGVVPRLDLQHGLFLVPGNPYVSFLDNTYSSPLNPIDRNVIRKYILPITDVLRVNLLEELDRQFQIGPAQLFPGSDFDSNRFRELALNVIDEISGRAGRAHGSGVQP
ncbi:MAG: FRG domain-containing protein [Leptospirales bacterium]|nr:FRG domain-containing protein [Leptospirales bacterium]